MADVRSALGAAAARLGERGEAEILLGHALGVDRAWLFAHALDALPADAASRFEACVARRAAGEPVAYITGHQGFWTLDLAVSPATLIPRPETEILVEQALTRLPEDCACSIVDLGTGSGAVALAIASERPLLHVLATDVSPAALAVAEANAQRLDLGRVRFAAGSWCAPLGNARFDLIVSNPPYVADHDPHLREGDLRHEPALALACGSDGLNAIRRIIHDATAHLHAGRWLLLEHGWTQGASVRALFAAAGYEEVFTAQDVEGRDRVSGGIRR